jgi:cellulose synthase/poly-beta-1,6-N-acetylglucosamine synthase-like glycosyltransferase
VTPRVSVVVPTHLRTDLLLRCLDALLSQDLPASEYEVIVCDDAASAETRCAVERRAAETRRSGPVIRYCPVTSGHGPAAARNHGWRAARGEIAAFTDDDCVPDPGWLRVGLAAMASGVAGVSGRIQVPVPPSPTDYERDAAGLESAEFATANCFYRRVALEAIGGFDQRFQAAWREDADVYFNLLERGETLLFSPEPAVVHPVRPGRWGVSLKQQRKSVYNALLYKKHPVRYRERIQPSPPWRYYVTVAAALISVFAALLRRHPLSGLAGALWLALTARFCLRRLDGTAHTPSHVAEMAVTSALIPPLSIYWRLRGALKYRVLFL